MSTITISLMRGKHPDIVAWNDKMRALRIEGEALRLRMTQECKEKFPELKLVYRALSIPAGDSVPAAIRKFDPIKIEIVSSSLEDMKHVREHYGVIDGWIPYETSSTSVVYYWMDGMIHSYCSGQMLLKLVNDSGPCDANEWAAIKSGNIPEKFLRRQRA